MQITYNNQVYLSNGVNGTSNATYAGRMSTLTLTNTGTANTVNYVVAGLPSNIASQSPTNGTILPNSPTTQVSWIGDFSGASITIANTTAPSLPSVLGVYLSAENK